MLDPTVTYGLVKSNHFVGSGLDEECEVEFLKLSSYRSGVTRPGSIRLVRDIGTGLKDTL